MQQRNNALDAFHRHLNACERCRRNPLNLCHVGHELLVRAAAKAKEASA